MSTFNQEDLSKLQKLSRLKLDAGREEHLLENIQKILDYMDMLDEVDTSDTPPLTHVITDMKAPLVEDKISDKLDTQEFLRQAPKKVGNFLKVPVVIEGKEEN
jgi:aspartyl-tRNA(Asn)/glutamyl-tRNA(Gln) amidotransferase subunit C